MNKPRVLIVSDYFYPHWTGIAKSLLYLIKEVRNVDFDVLTTKHLKNLKSEEKIYRSIIYRSPYLFSLSRLKYSPFIPIKLILLISRYDAIFINSPCSNILPVTLIAKIFGKKVVVFHQGDLILTGGLLNFFIEKAFDLSCNLSFFLSDKISTYSKDYAQHSRVMKPFLKKTYPLLMPIAFKKQSLDKKNILYKKLRNIKNEKKIIIGFAGRFVEEKGFDTLLKAIPKIVKKLNNVIFVFAGSINIDYENFYQKNTKLIRSVKNNLVLLGLLRQKELQIFYDLIDFVVVPSRSDCFNLVQAEAMLHGKPSLVSDIPGARYLVKQTGFGDTFISENPDDLSIKLTHLIRDNKIKNNYKKLQDILDNKKIIIEIEKFFRS